MRPAWIPSDVFRAWQKPIAINKWASVDGILPSSYICRCTKDGRPVKCVDGQYRLIDVFARARAMGHRFTLPLPTVGGRVRNAMERQKTALEDEVRQLENKRDQLRRDMLLESGDFFYLHPEFVALKSDILRHARPFVPVVGVYFLVKDGDVVYVGQSTNVHNRVATHAREKDFDGFCYLPVPAERLDFVESLYIHLLQPKLNGTNTNEIAAPINSKKLAAVLYAGVPA